MYSLEYIRSLRAAKRVKLGALADELGVSLSILSMQINGHRPMLPELRERVRSAIFRLAPDGQEPS